MQVGESSLKGLIEGEKQFQVPLYQRVYSWERPQHRQLWSDILELYHLLEPGGQQVDTTHFMGSLVLSPSPYLQPHGVTPFLVVDGQQRLTTLLIAIAALWPARRVA